VFKLSNSDQELSGQSREKDVFGKVSVGADVSSSHADQGKVQLKRKSVLLRKSHHEEKKEIPESE